MPRSRRCRRPILPFHVAVMILLAVVVESGCTERRQESAVSTASRDAPASSTADSGQEPRRVDPDALLQSAMELLQASQRGHTSHQLAAQRLNQYLAQERFAGKEPLESLDESVLQSFAAEVSPAQLDRLQASQFSATDMVHMEDCFLYRDIAQAVVARSQGGLAKAEAIFDWVVRNLQLLPPEKNPHFPVSPRIALIVGRCTEQERAWTFVELLRQAEIDSVVLAYEVDDRDRQAIRPWLPAVQIDNALYLFDTSLGLPVPGPGGTGIATLPQVLDDPSLLDRLVPDPEHPYRVRPEDLKRLVVWFESSPAYWSPRMRFIQERLHGGNRAQLWADRNTLNQRIGQLVADEIPRQPWLVTLIQNENSHGNMQYFDQISLMMLPYLEYEAGLTARLAHLRGKFNDAIPNYMQNRALLQDPKAPENMAEKFDWIRQDSTYFLGLAKFDQGEYEPAATWFGKRYLERYPQGKWVSGAHYNLGRCAELQNDPETAIRYYTTPEASAQMAGNLVRACRLGWTPGPPPEGQAEAESPTPPPASSPEL